MPAPTRVPVANHPYGEGPGELGSMPATPGDVTGLFAGGKSLADWLGEILTAPGTSKFPTRMRLTSIDPTQGQAILHDVSKFTPFETSLADLKKLLTSGELVPHGPKTEGMGVEALTKKLGTVARRKP